MNARDPHFRSLKRKLLLPLLVAVTGIAVATLWGINQTLQHQLTDNVRQRAELVANMVNYAAESTLRRGELQHIVTAIGAEGDVIDIVVAGGHPQRIIASTKNIWLSKLLTELPEEEVAEDLTKAIQTNAPHSHFNAVQNLFAFTGPLLLSHAELADSALVEGAVMVHLDTRPIQAATLQSTVVFSGLFLTTLGLLSALGYVLLNRLVLRPIIAIGKLVEHRDQGDAWEQLNSQDEIGALARTLRDALARTDSAMRALEDQKNALLESEERYRLIAAYSSDIIARFSVDGVFNYVSPASENVLGYESAKMIGTSLFDLIHPEDVATARQKLEHVRTSYQLETLTCRMRGVEGNYVWMETSLRGLREKSLATAVQIVGVSRDVSERIAVEGEIRDQAAHTRAIFDQMVDGIITIDTVGTIDSVNPAVTQIFGYADDELIGKNITMLMPNPHRDNHDDYLRNYAKTRVSRFVGIGLTGRDIQGQRKDRSLFPMDLAVSEITRQGQPMYVGMVRNISERKRVERLKNEFVAAVSHEIRTPMNAILGFTQLLSYDNNMTDKQKTSLGKVTQAGEHLLNIINDVLELSRIEAGKVTLNMEPVSVGPVLRNCLNLTQQQADARNIRLHLEIHEMESYCIRVDRTRLRQVLLNFLSNAVKYNRASGDIWLICTPAAPGRVRITIRDNGPGITADKQAEMFQPFNRLGAECSEIEGTGIGLTITKQLVEMMQGQIGLISTPGEGSAFWVEFAKDGDAPAASSSELKHAAPSALSTGAGHYRVLYVEDNPANRELIQALCANFWPNMQLQCTVTAEEGLVLATTFMPDLILMDINLPGIDGYQALEYLQADVALCEIPVVAISANASDANIERGIAAGFSAYLTKPVDIPRFLSVLDGLLAGTADAVQTSTHGARILLAEDNIVNQEVARGLLEKLGYEVDVVEDGCAAVEAVERARYAVILMDCEMPIMNGYIASTTIRNMEGTTRHTPIVAVTAHAPGDDAEQRVEAGMDDYLAKPLKIDELGQMLKRWIMHAPPPAVKAPVTTRAVSILDPQMTEQLTSILGARAAPIIDALLNDLPKNLALLRTAIDGGDHAAVRAIAHAMKGSSSNLGATQFAALCGKLSEYCKSGELQRLPEVYAALDQELRERVTPALATFKKELLNV